MAFLWQAVCGEGRVRQAWGHLLHMLQGSPGQSRLVGLQGRVGCRWVHPAGPWRPQPCVLLHGPTSLGVSPPLCTPHMQGCLETGDSIWAGCLLSGAGLGEPLGDDARIRTHPLLSAPLSHSHPLYPQGAMALFGCTPRAGVVSCSHSCVRGSSGQWAEW